MQTKRNLVLLGCCLGTLGTVSQVVLLRELLIAFTGNELTIATVLALWLVSVSLGCLAAGRSRGPASGHGGVAALFIMAGLFSLLQVLLIRSIRPVMTPAGEMLSPGMTVALAALGVAPSALLIGALFVRLVRYGSESPTTAPIPAVYGGEALGSAVAGVLLSFWLLEAANPITIVAAAACVGAICGILLLRNAPGRERLAGTVAAVICLASLAAVLASAHEIDLRLRNLQYRPLEVVESEDTKFGNIVVTARDGLHDFFETGALAFTIADPMFAEETVHIPLLMHSEPRRVLIIGASGSGVISEALKHPSVERVDFVELDPSMMALVERYAPAGWLRRDGEGAVAVLGDGRSYVGSTGAKYDVIIVAAGHPLSLQVNRLYTAEFFAEAAEALAGGGLVALKVDSPGAYMGPEFINMLGSIAGALGQVFDSVEFIPGDAIHLLGSNSPLAGRIPDLPAALLERGFKTSYVNDFVLADRLAPLRAVQLDSLLARRKSADINTDGRPVTFSYAIAIWARHFTTGRAVAWAVNNLGLGTCVILLSALAFIVVACYARGSGLGFSAAIPFAALYSVGFTTMFTQVLVMLCYQISRGYIYTRIAVLIAAFMIGLGLTATLAARRLAGAREYISLVLLQAGMVCLPIAVIVAFRQVQSRGAGLPGPAADGVYALLAFVGGALGGAVFTVASASLMRRRAPTVEAGAFSYSIDLIGASVAGFTTGFLTIPALGIVNAALAVGLVNFFVLGAMQFASRRSPGLRSR